MGYELKMYVVSVKQVQCNDRIALIDEKVRHCFNNEEDKSNYYYFDENDTKHYITKEPTIDAYYGQIIAMVDLCKCDLSNTGIWKFEEGDVYCFDNDGNSLIGLDSYGDYRKLVSIDSVLDEMKKLNEKENYRRFTIAISMLENVKALFPNENVGCIFFGH
jgi:hypothetical protein